MKCSLTIFGQVPGKKNSKRIVTNRRTNKPYIISSEKALDWKYRAGCQLFGQKFPEIKAQCKITMEFWNKDRRRHDLDNMAATVLDFLVERGVIQDDDCGHIDSLVLKFGGVCKESPRVMIKMEVQNDNTN